MHIWASLGAHTLLDKLSCCAVAVAVAIKYATKSVLLAELLLQRAGRVTEQSAAGVNI